MPGTSKPMTVGAEEVDVVVVGAGMAGLGAADELSRRGLRVVVVEGAAGPGGLVRSVNVGGEEVEAYYHHIFPQDRELRALVTRLGWDDKLEWIKASTAVLSDGRTYPFNSPLDLLRFRPLRFMARIRLGLGSVTALVRASWSKLDDVSVGEAGPRWFGKQGYDFLWRPLLDGKFGPYSSRVALAWLAGRMKQRALARKSGTGDRLGYLKGGIGQVAPAYADLIAPQGVGFEFGSPVESLTRTDDRWTVRCGGREFIARAVVACISGQALASAVALPEAYLSRVMAIPYRGVVCDLLELDRAVGTHYWVNLVEPTRYSCLAVIEHTNLIDASRYGGRHLIYLAHYVEVDGPVWNADVEEILAAVEPVMTSINPDFKRSWVREVHVSRDKWAQPVPLAGGPMPALPVETGLPGLFHASLAHIYPDDRGVSLALRLGHRVATATASWLDGNPTATPGAG